MPTGIQEYPLCRPGSRVPPQGIQEYPSTPAAWCRAVPVQCPSEARAGPGVTPGLAPHLELGDNLWFITDGITAPL